MVSTRNAANTTSPTLLRTVQHGRKAAVPSNLSSASAPASIIAATDAVEPVGASNKRKRGRNEINPSNEAALPTNPSPGRQNASTKRARTRVPLAEGQRRTGRTGQPASQDLALRNAKNARTDSERTDFATPVPNIMNFDGTLGDEPSQQVLEAIPIEDTVSMSLLGLPLRDQSLPVLDNFATQILSITATTSYQDMFNMATNPRTAAGQQWSQLITLFSETKKVYTSHDPFLLPQKLGLVDKGPIATIMKANMATFICGLFGGREDVGFSHLNEFFLDTFVGEGGKVLDVHIPLFIELKTQAYISAITSDKTALLDGHRRIVEILDALLPLELAEHLLTRRPGAAELVPTEHDLVDQARVRRTILFEQSDSEAAILALPPKYPWESFLRQIHSYIASHFDERMGTFESKSSGSEKPSNALRTAGKAQPQTATFNSGLKQHGESQGFPTAENANLQAVSEVPDNVAEKAARAAHFAMENYGNMVQQIAAAQSPPQAPPDNQAPSQYQNQPYQATGPPIQFHFERPLHPNVPSPPTPFFSQIPYQNGQMQGQWHQNPSGDGLSDRPFDAQGMIPYPTQSAPTHVLYERAREAASTKSSQQQPTRKVTTDTQTQRRPWTSEEENALMAGLDRVKGPHWSQIHAMFGPGGSINEVLQNRSQVQLKDKARNLKLFFLKSNIEVPYYLQFVTGELKTRAPSRLAKSEAKEKAMSEEDRAHVQGIMTLAGTANALQEEEEGRSDLVDQDGQEKRDQNGLALPPVSANDVNIDPSLERQLRDAQGLDASFTSRYPVPTPNMILQNLDKFSSIQDTG